MGILARFKDIMAANINALLDKAEDPEKMIDQTMRNLTSDLGKVKEETAAVMADEQRCKRELDECNKEIAEMQARAIIEAAINVNKETGLTVIPEIMVPLVASKSELSFVKNIITKVADELIAQAGVKLHYEVGTMIELPDTYLEKKVLERDPFQRLDRRGVGRLMKIATDFGREVRPNMHIGICGEHGGDPLSIEFCHNIGLTYVSCSPFRVPIARLAAAQAAIRNPRK